jgi:hypothetical protein
MRLLMKFFESVGGAAKEQGNWQAVGAAGAAVVAAAGSRSCTSTGPGELAVAGRRRRGTGYKKSLNGLLASQSYTVLSPEKTVRYERRSLPLLLHLLVRRSVLFPAAGKKRRDTPKNRLCLSNNILFPISESGITTYSYLLYLYIYSGEEFSAPSASFIQKQPSFDH